MSENNRQPHDPHVIDRSKMKKHKTSDIKFFDEYYDDPNIHAHVVRKILRQRYKYDDGSCAGWHDVPMVGEEK